MSIQKSQIFFRGMVSSIICALFLCSGQLLGHCQMPCGIYHDDMVYDLIDQYVETMYKGVSVLNNSKFSTTKEKNEFIRWVMEKEKASDQTAKLITEYFLQQKIKTGEADTVKRLVSAHKLLFLAMTIKQNTDLEFVTAFSDEWNQFKLMFHREGYECEIEKIKLKGRAEKKAALEAAEKEHSHDNLHAHDIPHTH